MGLSIWIRHIAEVIRRGVEEAFGLGLIEEAGFPDGSDDAIKEHRFGTSRPLDYPHYYRKTILHDLGLDASVKMNWYVEGETEFGFLRKQLGGPRDSQVEILNRHGRFTGKKNNIDLDFEAELRRDIEAERFSFVSFDTDVAANFRAIQRRIRADLIVGVVSASSPDFEFANFTLEELIEAAIEYDRTDNRHPIDSRKLLKKGNWDSVNSGGLFNDRYVQMHRHKRKRLKGERFGDVLQAMDLSPTMQSGELRPVWKAIRLARESLSVSHSDQRKHFKICSDNFEILE